MKFYIAAKWEEKTKVMGLKAYLTARGHEITFDWTDSVSAESVLPCERRKLGERDRQGVRDADILLIFPHEDAMGSLIEFGIAHDKPIFVMGDRDLFKLDFCPFLYWSNVHITAEDRVRDFFG